MIRILEKQIADKIAAGEVVERPLSVVKELLENAVDAGASAITVEIKNGGKSYIRVTDNGSGIAAGEVLLAFTRHATSKIATEKDLSAIHTLGFRGEALASIAAVSRVVLLTKTADQKTGKRVVIAGGALLENSDTGCPDGTTIVVTDVFFNTPARLKFLKSDSAEASVIIDFLSQMALAYPNIRMRLINNGNILFATNGKGDVRANILTVYSREIADALVPVDFTRDGARITGFVSSPGVSNATRRNQIFFVNGRVVKSKIIEKGVADAYSDRLFEGRYPAAFLFLQVAPDTLDVNIHPNKREVKFDDGGLISLLVRDAVRQALASKEAIPQIHDKNLFRMKEMQTQNAQEFSVREEASAYVAPLDAKPETQRNVREIFPGKEQVDIKSLLSNLRAEDEKKEEERADASSALSAGAAIAHPFDFSDLRIIGVIFNTYIALTDEDSFYLVDQHAAHERIFFEKLLSEYEEAEKVQQPLLMPILLNLPYGVSASAGESLVKLNDFGFEIEEFGPKTYAVKAVPAFMEYAEAESFLHYFAENVSDGSLAENRTALEKLMMRACKAAVKGGDALAPQEVESLIRTLAKCANPFSCPHGRPTFIRMKKYEIEKMFKRV